MLAVTVTKTIFTVHVDNVDIYNDVTISCVIIHAEHVVHSAWILF